MKTMIYLGFAPKNMVSEGGSTTKTRLTQVANW